MPLRRTPSRPHAPRPRAISAVVPAALAALAIVASLPACKRPAPPPPPQGSVPPPPPAAPKPRYGAVMAEIGRRFELAGRAANAKRFELAAFEIGELEEAFDEDLPLAEYPKEGPTEALPTLAENFRKTNLPALKKALDAKDAAAFGVAFEQAATACNGCHTASQHAFLEIPTKPGGEVPKITP